MEWDREVVEDMANDWQESSDIIDKMNRLALLLEEDSVRTFRKLLGLLLDNKELVVPDEQLPLLPV